MTFFTGFTAGQHAVAKFLYSCPEKYTEVHAPTWYNMIVTFIYGGVSQHGETLVGNLCADLNGMGGGARADRDGEHALAPIFAHHGRHRRAGTDRGRSALPAAGVEEDDA
jgi:acetone carboxylase alpha subunit